MNWTKHSYGSLGGLEIACIVLAIVVIAIGFLAILSENKGLIVIFIILSFLSALFVLGVGIFFFISMRTRYWKEYLGCNADYKGFLSVWNSIDTYLQIVDQYFCGKNCPCYFGPKVTKLYTANSTTAPYYHLWEKYEFNDDSIKYYKVNGIYVVNGYYQNDSYYIQLNCSNSKNYFVYCTGDFSYVPYGYYEIKIFKYDYQYYNLTNRTTFYVNKKSYDDNVELLNISGLAYTGEQNNLTLIFNKNIESRYLSEFIFTDTKTNYSYIPYFYCYYTNYSMVDCIFNFSYIPSGYYRTAFTYKNKTKNSNAYLYVQERKVYQEIELLNVYSNLIKYTRDQVVYLSFIGKYETDTLAYIVLDDFYSRKYVLQTLQCYHIYSNYTQFDLRCKVDLSNVPSGLYKVSEYYIYNKHYYSSMNINVNVFSWKNITEFY